MATPNSTSMFILLLSVVVAVVQLAIFSPSMMTTTESNVISSQKSMQLAPDYHWCPFGAENCDGTALCQPCRDRFLIIVATGRSGSTTLMQMIDSLPNMRISGENLNALRSIRAFLADLTVSLKASNSNSHFVAWKHNPVPQQSFACLAQQAIKTINPPLLAEGKQFLLDDNDENNIIGFKTIRFLEGLKPGQEGIVVKFVKDYFPCSRIVVNIRSDEAAQRKSSWYAFNEDARSKITNHTRGLQRVAELFGSQQAMVMDSSEWSTNITKLNQLVDWLGFSRECHFRSLVKCNTNKKTDNTCEPETAVEYMANSTLCRYLSLDPRPSE